MHREPTIVPAQGEHSAHASGDAAQRGLPPPVMVDLSDANQRVGWIRGDTLGFRGFADASEASQNAWVARRRLMRRHARRRGGSLAPDARVAIALQTIGGRERILADNELVATLVRPGADSLSGPDSFGFELELPTGGGEISARASAYL